MTKLLTIKRRSGVRKLFDIRIDEISAVDRPANRRPFLIMKQEAEAKTMEVKPLRTDEEIQEFITKHYGSFSEYRARRFDPLAEAEPEPVKKSDAEVCADYLQAVAEVVGGYEKLFREKPDEYRRYRELAAVRI